MCFVRSCLRKTPVLPPFATTGATDAVSAVDGTLQQTSDGSDDFGLGKFRGRLAS